ncbi:hypothetical protein B484DRAFT_455473, partial [Ochromonadaceae sp. CCMP2298]
MTSIHMRKGAVYDAAMDHELHDFMDDDHSDDDSDDEAPETKKQNFEFSDGYGVMRFLRMCLVVQVLSLALENPSIPLAVLFKIACRGVLFYAQRFYSRPFIDLLYVLQFFYKGLIAMLPNGAGPTPSNVEITSRRLTSELNANPYTPYAPYADKPDGYVLQNLYKGLLPTPKTLIITPTTIKPSHHRPYNPHYNTNHHKTL